MGLTSKEYKDLVIDLVKEITPILLKEKKYGSDILAETAAKYATDVADSVNDALEL